MPVQTTLPKLQSDTKLPNTKEGKQRFQDTLKEMMEGTTFSWNKITGVGATAKHPVPHARNQVSTGKRLHVQASLSTVRNGSPNHGVDKGVHYMTVVEHPPLPFRKSHKVSMGYVSADLVD